MIKKNHSVLFDLDGTLTDSGPGIIRCAGIALEKLGHPCYDTAAMRRFVGPPLNETFQKFGIPQEKILEAIEIYRENYSADGIFENSPYPGVEKLLDRLQKSGHRLYIATSKPESMALAVTDHFHLTSYFNEIAGASADRTRINKNDVIRYLQNKVRSRTDEGHFPDSSDSFSSTVVMVGDTCYDVFGAAMMGIPCIGVSWGYGPVEELLNAGAIGIADTMDELYELIEAFENKTL